MTLSEALKLWSPRHEALRLLSYVTGYNQTEILVHGELELLDEAQYKSLVNQRKNHVPLQYILNRWDFYGLEFIVDSRALIPRQDTEILAESVLRALERINKNRFNQVPRVLDICTGSGCLAVVMAVYGGVDVTAVDISPQALSLARENAVLNEVAEKIRFVESDLFAGLRNEVFDLIVSNPPYIPTNEINKLQEEVKAYEPFLALDGGCDGMDIYRRLIPESMNILSPGGALFLEIGPWRKVMDLMTQAGFENISTIKDYARNNRVVKGTKAGEYNV